MLNRTDGDTVRAHMAQPTLLRVLSPPV
eukprot:SAG11_NODE_9753_length_883_cov_0.829082_1_plen_27_part_01